MIHETLEISGSHNITGSLLLPLLTEETTLAPGGLAHLDGKTYICNGTNWLQLAETLQAEPSVEYLVVAGGGGSGGGGSTGYHGGGGGGGGLLSGSIPSTTATFTVTIGAGGSAGAQSGDAGYSGTNGQDSSISGTSITTITSVGGGAGAGNQTTSPASRQGNDGGSGGGGALYSGVGGSGTDGQGNDGGNASANYQGAGGGGGAGTAGGNSVSAGGSGGEGKYNFTTGTATYYGGGGAGRGQSGNGAAVNGATAVNTAGAANKGAGGGGRQSTSGMAGGSGVAIFAYDSGSINAAGGIIGDAGNGRKYHKFNQSGTFYIGSPSDFNFVTDNLILHLDAGNSDSYPGSGQTWYDLSGNGYDHTLGNTSCWNSGGWMDFSATGAKYLPGGTLTNIPNTDGECTVQTWTKFLSNPSSCRTLMRGYGGDHHVLVDCSSPYLSIGRYDNDGAGFVDSGYDIDSIPNYLSEFHNMVFKLNTSSPYWSYYYDNNLSTPASTITASTGTNNRGFAGVGSYHNNNSTVSSHSQYWGYVSVFLAYNGTLTEAQMLQNYNAFTKRFSV